MAETHFSSSASRHHRKSGCTGSAECAIGIASGGLDVRCGVSSVSVGADFFFFSSFTHTLS